MTETIAEAARQTSKPSRGSSFADARNDYQDTVFRFVARRVRPVEEAEDIVAVVFVEAYRHWHRRQPDIRLWLLGIARHKVADSYRRRKAPMVIRDSDAVGNSMDDFVIRAEVSAAQSVLSKLPEPEREAILMSVVEEFSISEIASILSRSEKATNSLLGRARTRVRKLIEQQGDFE